MHKTFSTPLSTISEALTFMAMASLTVASAAAFAFPVNEPEPVVYLPTVVVTAKSTHSAEPVRLPLVEVTAKRSSGS